ncbi:MAG TPA: leucyl/phenylalanyl-tRNA--protein transferase [Nitrospiria bacterium]|nr:leucyl/phenylalanyl-tRNA--protein transferase [Nitrospiria bacterium]
MDEPLTPELLVQAYAQGFFPMGEEDGSIAWYWPDPRTIIPLDGFHVSKRLVQTVRQQRFKIAIDHDFEGVMRGCADREETWITEPIVAAYTALHRQGVAHSIEAYKDGRLVGGIYGVSLGGAFMGESMFSRVTDASKVCLVHLVERLRERGYTLFDVQFTTEHLKRFGAVEIPRKEYLTHLRIALRQACHFA